MVLICSILRTSTQRVCVLFAVVVFMMNCSFDSYELLLEKRRCITARVLSNRTENGALAALSIEEQACVSLDGPFIQSSTFSSQNDSPVHTLMDFDLQL